MLGNLSTLATKMTVKWLNWSPALPTVATFGVLGWHWSNQHFSTRLPLTLRDGLLLHATVVLYLPMIQIRPPYGYPIGPTISFNCTLTVLGFRASGDLNDRGPDPWPLARPAQTYWSHGAGLSAGRPLDGMDELRSRRVSNANEYELEAKFRKVAEKSE